MKFKIGLALMVAVGLAALILGYMEMSQEQAADAAADQPISAASRVQAGTNGESVIALDQKTQQLIGLRTATLTAAMLPPEIKAYGRVLDPAPLAALASDLVSARAALAVTDSEFERLNALSQGHNVSAKALEDAGAAQKHDQAALASAQAQLAAVLGNGVATRPDLSAFIASLVKQEILLVRLDVPAGEWPGQTPVGALVSPPSGDQPIAASFLDRAATADPQVQGAGFLFIANNDHVQLMPGLNVTGFLQMPGEPLSGVIVPEAAVVRSDDRAWFYAQTSETNFVRREIMLYQPAADGWFTTNVVAPGDKVVTTGAQVLLSEERKSEIKLED